jgi:glycerophosphoryl diester phosphodiesterase
MENTMWPYPKIVAHRGAGTLAPENTLAAMQCGLDYGFHAVEFDVMLSKDGVPVLMHDPEFGRTVKGVGTIATTLFQDLIQMDAGSWMSEQFSHVRIPSYEEVFLFCQKHRIWMNVEIKPAPGFEVETGKEVARMTAALLKENSIMPLFSSFEFDTLMSAKQEAPLIPRGFLMDVINDDWQHQLRQLDAVALHTNHKHLTSELCDQIKQAGYGLFCYTVNSTERANEILAWGVDSFCTDRIELFSSNS